MKCSRCGTELTGLLSDQCPKVSCLGNVPEPSVKRKPIQWHLASEDPQGDFPEIVAFKIRLFADPYGGTATEVVSFTYVKGDANWNDVVVWCYKNDLLADARDAMEGEG